VLVGSPNVGKSLIFGLLVHKYVVVSNYPGTTVEITQGKVRFGRETLEIIDPPGVNSLIPRSEDESITREILINNSGQIVIQVADATRLSKSLRLTTQLAELNLPLILVLNLMDEASERGIFINVKKLEALLGIKVIPTIAVQKRGIGDILKALPQASVPTWQVNYPKAVEELIEELTPTIAKASLPTRGVALALLSGDEELLRKLGKTLTPQEFLKLKQVLKKGTQLNPSLDVIISDERDNFINNILKEVLERVSPFKSTLRERVESLTIHPIWGSIIIGFLLLFMYIVIGQGVASKGVDFLKYILELWLVTPLEKFTNSICQYPLVIDLLFGDYGLISKGLVLSLAVLLPIITVFFLFFSFLEDLGYLSRLTILVHKAFSWIGISGKAVIPMVLGLGCVTMATLSTRILEQRKSRLITTLLLALGVPCSAQLGIILSFAAFISPLGVLAVLVIVIAQIFIVGKVATLILAGRKECFLLELPPFRLPRFRNIILKTYYRVEWFLKEAVPLFLVGFIILFIFDKTAILLAVEKLFTPLIVGGLGLPKESVELLFMGFLRKDFAAAELLLEAKQGLFSYRQMLVALVTTTLFVPCISTFLMIIKEFGVKVAIGILSFVMIYSLLIGSILNFTLKSFNI